MMDGVKDLEKSFMKNSKDIIVSIQNNMTLHMVKLDLPKFKFQSEINLQNTLEKVSVQNVVTYKPYTFSIQLYI